jgi:large subunit ribosomal protein L2
MNPVDHPMGGGEGRASGGHPVSRTGIMAKGQKTRASKQTFQQIISKQQKKI